MHNVKIKVFDNEQDITTYSRGILANEGLKAYHAKRRALREEIDEIKTRKPYLSYQLPFGTDREIRYSNPTDIYEIKQEVERLEEKYNRLYGRRKEGDKAFMNSVNRSKAKIYDLARANSWDWFLTLTFDPKKVDSQNYKQVVAALGKWLKAVRRKYDGFGYIMIPERHKSGAWHFHGLCFGLPEAEFKPARGAAGAEGVFNLKNYSSGFTTATRVKDLAKVARYVTKYLSKDLARSLPNSKRYWASRNLSKPTVLKEYVENIDGLRDHLKDQTESYTTIVNERAEMRIDYFTGISLDGEGEVENEDPENNFKG